MDCSSIISNKINNIEEGIAPNQIKINEQLELEKKIEHSVAELWKPIEIVPSLEKRKVIDIQEQSHER